MASLFTNIVLSETIKLVIDLIKIFPWPKHFWKKSTTLFNFATCETHFLFKDQIDGVAMGSFLAPVLANLFMGHYEKNGSVITM